MNKIINYFLVGITCSVSTTFAQTKDWVRQISSSNYDVPIEVQIDKNENIWSLSRYSGNILYQKNINDSSVTSKGGIDALLLKHDKNGKTVKAKTFGGSGSDQALQLSLVDDKPLLTIDYSSKDWIIKPNDTLKVKGTADILLLQLNENLEYLWHLNISGDGDEYVCNTHVDENGYIYLIGNFTGTSIKIDTLTLLADKLNEHFFITKLTPNGKVVWGKYMNAGNDNYPYGLATDKIGNVYFGGFSSSWINVEKTNSEIEISTDLPDFSSIYMGFIAKLDQKGNFKKYIKMPTKSESRIHDMAIYQDKIYVGGYYFSDTYFNPKDSKFVTRQIDNKAMYIAQYDTSLNFNWVNGITNGFVQGEAIGINQSNGDVAITGDYFGSINFDPLNSSKGLLTTSNSTGAYWAMYDINGKFIMTDKFDSDDNSETGLSIKISPRGSIAWTPAFWSSTISYVSKKEGSVTLINSSPTGGWESSLIYYTDNILSFDSNINVDESEIEVFPNPTSSKLYINSPNFSGSYQILDAKGTQIINDSYNTSFISINLESLPNGLYLIVLDGKYYRKVLKSNMN